MIKVHIQQPVIVTRIKYTGVYHWAIPTHGTFDHSSKIFVEEFFSQKGLEYIIVEE